MSLPSRRSTPIAACALALACATAGPAASPIAGMQSGDRATEIATAGQAFLATLTQEQRRAVLFRFDDDAQRHRWSNFPTGFVPRAGLRWGDLDARQRAALTALLGAVLSPDGVRMVQEQMAADDVLRTRPHAPPPGDRRGPPGAFPPDWPMRGPRPGFGPPPGGPFRFGGRPPGFGGSGGGDPEAVQFGSDHYYVSLLGVPSAATPWMLQFGGHHLAINATVIGARVTFSPSLTGGEPLRFTQDGRRVYIVEKEVTAAAALLAALSPAQRARAVVSSEKIDLVLGPGQDGRVLQPEGLPGSAMTPAQKAMLLALVETRLGIFGADAHDPAMAAIRAGLDQTSFAWFGPATPLGAAYFRVTGPTVLIEYAPQDMDGDATDHAHNIYRDPTNEYGVRWTAAR